MISAGYACYQLHARPSIQRQFRRDILNRSHIWALNLLSSPAPFFRRIWNVLSKPAGGTHVPTLKQGKSSSIKKHSSGHKRRKVLPNSKKRPATIGHLWRIGKLKCQCQQCLSKTCRITSTRTTFQLSVDLMIFPVMKFWFSCHVGLFSSSNGQVLHGVK